MVGSWYVLVMCEKEPLLLTPPLPSNGQKTSKCGGIFTKKQSAALTLEARIMNFLVLNPQVIPHRTGHRVRFYWVVEKKISKIIFFISTLIISISVDMLGRRSSRKIFKKKKKNFFSTLSTTQQAGRRTWVVGRCSATEGSIATVLSHT